MRYPSAGTSTGLGSTELRFSKQRLKQEVSLDLFRGSLVLRFRGLDFKVEVSVLSFFRAFDAVLKYLMVEGVGPVEGFIKMCRV